MSDKIPYGQEDRLVYFFSFSSVYTLSVSSEGCSSEEPAVLTSYESLPFRQLSTDTCVKSTNMRPGLYTQDHMSYSMVHFRFVVKPSYHC